MSKPFVLTIIFERTLSELASSREQAAQIEPVLFILSSRNFHWLELKMKNETTFIEAIRADPLPDRKHQWKWPDSFRVIHSKKGRHTQQEIERGLRGKGIFTLEIGGVKPYDFSLTRMMSRKSFISLSFQVGRQIKIIAPRKEDPGKQAKERKHGRYSSP